MAAPLENVLVVEKMMDLETVDNPKGVVYIGPTNQSLFKYAASSASDTNIIFNNICAPSLSTVMKRTLRVELLLLGLLLLVVLNLMLLMEMVPLYQLLLELLLRLLTTLFRRVFVRVR